MIAFAAAGDSITVTAGPAVGGCCTWDFFIDNIHFNEPLPAPEPSTLALLGAALAGISFTRRRKLS